MFGRSLKLFTIFGFEVRVNVSWAFLAILIAVSLALGSFPVLYEGWPATTYWWMAVVGVIGVFFSIVIHELSHSLAARAFGMQMRGITLFLFGGVAEMEQEPKSAKAEFFMAIAGPAISIVLGFVFISLAGVLQGAGDPTPASATIEYLGLLNFILAAFNLVPAFPMDGGRVLRAALWAIRGDIRWATKWASRLGAAFGLALILGGVFFALMGAFVQGLWWFLIGMFIRGAALGSYQQLEIKRMMRGVKIADVMEHDLHTVAPDMALSDFVERFVYEFHQTDFPVVQTGDLVGEIGVHQVRNIPRNRWTDVSVREVMTPIGASVLADPGEDALDALMRLQSTGQNSLIVARRGNLMGMVSRADIMKLLNLKMDLEAA